MSDTISFPATPKGQLLRLYNAVVSPIQKRYYMGIAVQTDHDYRQSERFKMRYEVVGLDQALSMYMDNPAEREYYFNETRKHAPLLIRVAHLWDAIMNNDPRPYTFD